jgi:hypothetical protein
MTKHSLSLLCAPAAIVAVCCATARGDPAGPSREYQLKAAFLYNFAQFAEWPDDAFKGPRGPIVIAVAGENPFGGTLEQAVRGKQLNGREITVRYFPSAAAVEPCHVLFVSASERNNVPQALQRAGSYCLTVGDVEGFTARGGIFRFLVEDNKVRFEVNIDAAQHARVKISSRLLKLAKIYEP